MTTQINIYRTALEESLAFLFVDYMDDDGSLTIRLLAEYFSTRRSPREASRSLQEDIANMRSNGSATDAVIESADGVHFDVHSQVVVARSPVLAAAFSNSNFANSQDLKFVLNAPNIVRVFS